MAVMRARITMLIPSLFALVLPVTVSYGWKSEGWTLLNRKQKAEMVKCSEMAARSQCMHSGGKCRWCRSDVLDDACFSKLEAWRFPQQIFSCD